MIDKTRLGLSLFDDRYGGIFRGRPALCVGRQGSGKTIAAIQSVMQSVKEGERGLLLSGWRAADLTIIAQRMGFPLAEAVAKGQITLLEYADILPSPESEMIQTLPPGSFMEFRDIVESSGIRRVVIDTILPWVAIPEADKLAKHIYSFVQAFERMGVTALLTIPKPVSPLAFTLRNRLEEQIPVVFTLDVDDDGKHSLLINKYLGEKSLPPSIPFLIAPGAGIIRAPKKVPAGAVAPTPSRSPEPTPAARPILGVGPIKFSAAFRP